jgi:hypothetical protein
LRGSFNARSRGAIRKHRVIYVPPKCALFAAVLVCGTSAVRAQGPELAQIPVTDAANPLSTISLEHLKATRERPLFAPDRRQRVSASVVVAHSEPLPAPPREPPKLLLLGTVIGGEEARAEISTDTAGKTALVRTGDDVGGWRVTKIEPHQLQLSLDDRSVTVTMFANRRGGQVAGVHHPDRVFEVNAAGVLRSHFVHTEH